MLDALSPRRRRLVLASFAVVLAVAVVIVVVAVVRAADRTDPVAQDTLGPVIVVPGYGGNVSSVGPIVNTLRAQGRDVTVFRPDDGGTGDLDRQAEGLGEKADSVLEAANADSVDVVGYSAGGVVARLWVRDHGGASIARRVLTIASPHHGTDVAALADQAAGSCPTACEQLVPDSDVLRALNAGDETPKGPVWITVRTDNDAVVTPTESASLDGALNVLVQDVCPAATPGHAGMPNDRLVIGLLSAVLERSEPAVPTASSVSC